MLEAKDVHLLSVLRKDITTSSDAVLLSTTDLYHAQRMPGIKCHRLAVASWALAWIRVVGRPGNYVSRVFSQGPLYPPFSATLQAFYSTN